VVGREVTGVEILHADVLRVASSAFTQAISGLTIRSVERRGKNVVMPLTGDRVLAVNLGMTGKLLPFPAHPVGGRAPTHPAVRFELDDGSVLVFDDTRRFGTVECLETARWRERSGRMGPEPLGSAFTARRLYEGLRQSRSPIRSWLLDQRKVAGVGNIYANEALYLAGIDPRRPARQVDAEEAARLQRALRRVLRNAIRQGGTTLRDYRTAEGDKGQYGSALGVYGRAGEPCLRCGTAVERVVFGNRSAFLCPTCQPGQTGTGDL